MYTSRPNHRDEEDGRLFSKTSMLKTIFYTCLLSLSLGLNFITTPVVAEYTNKEAKQHYENALTYIGKGHPDLAVKEMEEAVRLEPEVMEGRRYLAVAYSLRMELRKAVEEYNALFRANPGLTEVPAIKVRWLEENNRLIEELKQELIRIHEEQPENPMVHALLGWLYGEQGKLKVAHKELLHALERHHSMEKEDLEHEDKVVADLLLELVTAMQNSPNLAKTQLDLLLFALNRT